MELNPRMATPGETVALNSQAEAAEASSEAADAIASSNKALYFAPPPQTATPVLNVARMKKAVDGRTVEEMKREVEKMESQIDADKAEMERLRKRIEGLKGERVFESQLFQSCRELINMRYARGLTPLSSAERTNLQEIQDLALRTMKQYAAAKGSLPAFIGGTPDGKKNVLQNKCEMKEAAFEPTDSMENKEVEELMSLGEKMVQVQDVALDTKLEAIKVNFDLGDILRRQYMERWWMEIKITFERSWIADKMSPLAPYFNGCARILRGNMRVEDIAMTTAYDSVMAVEPVNLRLLAALREIGPDGVASLRSEQLKRKWAPQEEELFSNEDKRAKLVAVVEGKFVPVELLKLQGGDSELLDEEDDDGKLYDVKRLDKEIELKAPNKAEWRRSAKESYEWYYPLAELSSREEHLAKLAACLARQADVRGTALPTESEVIGCMLLDLLTTSAMSPSESAAFFPAP